METDVTHKIDPVKGLAVTDVMWGDVPHPDDKCKCPESCTALVHLVRVFAPTKWGVYARVPESLEEDWVVQIDLNNEGPGVLVLDWTARIAMRGTF